MNDVPAITSLFFEGGRDHFSLDPQVTALRKTGDTTGDPQARLKAYGAALAHIRKSPCWVPMFSCSVALHADARRARAVDGVNLALRRGEIHCIVGESGSAQQILPAQGTAYTRALIASIPRRDIVGHEIAS